MTVGVLEIEPDGHRLQYVRHLVEAAGPDGAVVLTSERAVGSEEFTAHVGAVAARTLVLPATGSRRVLLATAVAQAEQAGVRRLVVPDGDLYLMPLLLLLLRRPRLRTEFRVLLMRTAGPGGPERMRPAMMVKPVLTRLLRLFPQVRVRFLTDALGVVAARPGFAGVRGVRDPVVPIEAVDRVRPDWFPAADPGVVLVGVFGVVSARKNVPLLVEALASVPGAVLVVGGRLDPEVRELVGSAAARALASEGRLVVVDRMLGAAEFDAALAAVDMVAVLHDNDSPSGILAEACMRHTPVLVPEGGWLARICASTGLGVATPLDARAVAAAVRRIAADRDSFVASYRRHAPRMDTADFTDGLIGS